MLELGLKVTFEAEGVTKVGQIVNFAGGMKQAVIRTTGNQIWSVPVADVTVSKELTRTAYLNAFKDMTTYRKSIQRNEQLIQQGQPNNMVSVLEWYEQADALTRRIEAWAGSVGYALPDYSEVQRYCNGGFGVSSK